MAASWKARMIRPDGGRECVLGSRDEVETKSKLLVEQGWKFDTHELCIGRAGGRRTSNPGPV